jgi:hypothetical protein
MIKHPLYEGIDEPMLSAKDTKVQKQKWAKKANEKRSKSIANGGKEK